MRTGVFKCKWRQPVELQLASTGGRRLVYSAHSETDDQLRPGLKIEQEQEQEQSSL